MFIPYRVKNPIKRFPIATVVIIAINVLVYAFTTQDFLEIREDVVKSYAFALGVTPLWTMFTAAFLHADPLHLIGNMLFLWVFGPPVEDRLGVLRYILMYFIAGFCGDLLQGALDIAVSGHVLPGIGASGCIMGVLGAYWFLFSWSTVCVFYWFGYIWHGTWEIEALWIIGIYLLMDLAEGIFSGATGLSGGVANFAHVGGGLGGALICLAMRAKRDSEEVSDAKAIQSDLGGDISMLPFHALQSMLEEDPYNLELLHAIVVPAVKQGKQGAIEEAVTRFGPQLVEKDPAFTAYYLLDVHGAGQIFKPVHLLRVAGTLESSGDTQRALRMYQLIVQKYGTEPEVETALYRMAQCAWTRLQDIRTTQACLNEMVKRFPRGNMIPFAKTLWQQIQQSSGGSRSIP